LGRLKTTVWQHKQTSPKRSRYTLPRRRPFPGSANTHGVQGARDGGPRGKPNRCDHRYAGCKSDRKRGPQKDLVGYDAAKKIKGIKRNVIVDTIGLLLGIAVIPANIQDRDCAADLIRKTRCLFPWIVKLFADGGYAGAKLNAALAGQPVELEIVRRTDKEGGFKVIRRRWVVERTLSWLRRNRRLMAHYEAFAIIAEGYAKLAMICIMLKRLAEPKPDHST
jgi:transposase